VFTLERTMIARILLSLLIALLLFAGLVAADGDQARLDPRFGHGGKLKTNVTGSLVLTTGFDVDGRGRIYVLGQVGLREGLFRFRPNGELDRRFGRNGIRENRYGRLGLFQDVFALQPDGDLVTGCDFRIPEGPTRPCLWIADPRHPSKGRIVKVGAPLEEGAAAPTWLAIGPRGQIAMITTGRGGALVVRFHPNGTVDKSFSNNGQRGFRTRRLMPAQIQFDRRGGLIVSSRAGLYRLRADGTRDHSFGRRGLYPGRAEEFAVDSRGRIVLIRAEIGAEQPTGTFRVIRLHSNSVRDRSFGRGGVRRLPRYEGAPYYAQLAVRRQRVFVGYGSASTRSRAFRLLSLNRRGNLDREFGGPRGYITTRLGRSSVVGDLSPAPGRRLVAAAELHRGTIGFARYIQRR